MQAILVSLISSVMVLLKATTAALEAPEAANPQDGYTAIPRIIVTVLP